MHPDVGIDPDEARIERGVMDLGQWNAIRDDRVRRALVAVRDDGGSVEKHRLRQPGERAASSVGCNDSVAE